MHLNPDVEKWNIHVQIMGKKATNQEHQYSVLQKFINGKGIGIEIVPNVYRE